MAGPARGGRRWLALALALLLCVALALIHRQSERARGTDPVTRVLRDDILIPAQTVTARLGRWWRGTVITSLHGPRLARQNAALQARVLALTAQNKQLLAAQAENDRLRRLLDFEKKSPQPLLAAEVVALKPTAQTDTLTLNRGSRDGVRPQDVVLAPNGALVGQVLDASPRSCSVLMVTDLGSSAGGQVVGRPNAPVGVCQGDRAGHLRLTYLPSDADVRPGDAVSTSGLHGVYPKGIPIGAVISVTLDRARSIKTALVRPAADLDHLEEAFLLQDRGKP